MSSASKTLAFFPSYPSDLFLRNARRRQHFVKSTLCLANNVFFSIEYILQRVGGLYFFDATPKYTIITFSLKRMIPCDACHFRKTSYACMYLIADFVGSSASIALLYSSSNTPPVPFDQLFLDQFVPQFHYILKSVLWERTRLPPVFRRRFEI